MLIVGSELLQRQDGNALLSAAVKIADSAENAASADKWKVFNVLQKVMYVGSVWPYLCLALIQCLLGSRVVIMQL